MNLFDRVQQLRESPEEMRKHWRRVNRLQTRDRIWKAHDWLYSREAAEQLKKHKGEYVLVSRNQVVGLEVITKKRIERLKKKGIVKGL